MTKAKKDTKKAEVKKEELGEGIPNKTEDELKELAMHLFKGNVFTDLHLRSEEDVSMLGSIFMPLIFMNAEDRKSMHNVGMVYEFFDKAGPRSINGYPMFMSFECANVEDTKKVWEMYNMLRKQEDEFMGKGKKTNEEVD